MTRGHPKKSAQRTVMGRAEAKDQPQGGSPLFGVAMLKIAMELKKPDAGVLDEIISSVLTRMGLPEDEFRAYLAQNGGLLRSIAQKRRE